KEIFEQPAVIGDTLNALINPDPHRASARIALCTGRARSHNDDRLRHRVPCLRRRQILARADRPYFGRDRHRLGIPLPRAGDAAGRRGDLRVAIGRDRRTLAALRYAKAQDQKIIAIVNQPESTIAREADVVLPTLAGPEIGVASTKAFTTQLAVLASMTVAMARARGAIDHAREAELVGVMTEIPSRTAEVLNHDERIREIAAVIAEARDVLYLGRGGAFPLALEGALKLKEISYIHAEGYAAGEMKHGPIALIDENVPVIVLAPHDDLFEKTLGNVEEVMARGGRVVMISDAAGVARLAGRIAIRLSRPCSMRSRSNSSPTTPPSSKALTSTSPA